jgi:hypothetical protein
MSFIITFSSPFAPPNNVSKRFLSFGKIEASGEKGGFCFERGKDESAIKKKHKRKTSSFILGNLRKRGCMLCLSLAKTKRALASILVCTRASLKKDIIMEKRTSPLKIGFIGCGGMGSVHLQALAALSHAYPIEVTAIADVTPAHLAKGLALFPKAKGYNLRDGSD